MAKILGAILAGGKATRMNGRNKALLTVGGQPMLARARAALALAETIAVAGGTTMSAEDAGGLTLLADSAADAGPLAGLAPALSWADAEAADWLLTAPVDAPFLTDGVFTSLLDAAHPEDEAVFAEADGRIHWLTAAWRPTLAGHANAALAGADLSIARFARGARHSTLAIAGGSSMFLNVNTPADLKAAEQQARRTRTLGE